MTSSNVILIGMRGSGKTTLGGRLAAALGYTFVDLDERISARAGLDVDRLLAERGEARLRAVEREVLSDAVSLARTVIATGGGAVLHGERFEALAATGVVVYLRADVTLLERRGRLRPRPPLTDRPLADEIATLLADREPRYRSAAQIVVQVDDGDPILDALLGKLRNLGIG